jgi:cytochrome c biogenesis protein CcmG/thiol:disulfide interchange protein DsbE
MNKYLLIPLALFIGLAAFLFVGLSRDPRELPSALINKAAPDFQLQQLNEPARTLSAKDLRGLVTEFLGHLVHRLSR